MSRAMVVLGGIGCMLLLPAGVLAQGLDLRTPPEHQDARAQTRPADRDLYPYRPSVPHAPAFLTPFSKRTETGRAGVAGWTAPNTPVGSRGAADPDSSGWLGLGFALQWGARPGMN